MTAKVFAVSENDSLSSIATGLLQCGIGAAPVTNSHGTVIGIVSEVDVMRALLAGHTTSVAAELMTTPVLCADEFATTDDVIRLLQEHRIHHLPVTREGKLIGIIAASDIVRYFVEREMPRPPETA